MKKLMILILFSITSISLISSDEINYIDITSYSNAKIIALKNFEDFQNLMISHNINSFYRFGTNNGRYTPGPLNSKVIMIIDDIWYSFATRGFKTIYDYTDGLNRGFRNASDYYYCIKHEISTYDVFSKLKKYMFFTEDDYLEAISMGIFNIIENKVNINNTSFTYYPANEGSSFKVKKTDIIISYPEIITIANYRVITTLDSSFFNKYPSSPGSSWDPRQSNYNLRNDTYILKDKGKTIAIDELNLVYIFYFMKIEGFSNLEKYLLFSKAKISG